MSNAPQQQQLSSSGVFNDGDTPSRGFVGEIIAVITHPSEFFYILGTKRASQKTVWVAVLILVILSFNVLHTPVANDSQGDSVAPPITGIPGEGPPFDPGFPPNGSENNFEESPIGDPTAQWMAVLKTVGAQIVKWGALAWLLALVPAFNGQKSRLKKHIQIAVWSSIPLALMSVLQLAFMNVGGKIASPGFTGFLAELPAFNQQNIYLQSFIHGIASQLTLFWLWSLGLLYLGAKITLHGKRPIVTMVIVIWIVLTGLGNGIQSYNMLSKDVRDNDGLLPPDSIIADDLMFGENLNFGEYEPIPIDDSDQLPDNVKPQLEGQ